MVSRYRDQSAMCFNWMKSLRWRHNGRYSVSNHQHHDCLLNRLFRRRSKKSSTLRVTGLCVGNSPGPVNSPHKWTVTRKMFPFDDVIMLWECGNTAPKAWLPYSVQQCHQTRLTYVAHSCIASAIQLSPCRASLKILKDYVTSVSSETSEDLKRAGAKPVVLVC